MIADRIRSIQAVSGGGGGGGGDPYFADRILILNLDGDFSDSGPNAFTVTPYGNAQIVGDGAFGTVASFDGSGDYLESPSHPNFALGLGDFTIEFWVKLANISSFRVMFDARSTSNGKVPVIYTNGGKLRYVAEGVERIFGDTMSTGSWYHIAAVRSESQTKLYLNGTQVGNTFADTTDYQQSGFRFGYFPGTPSAAFNGLLGPLIVSKRADYTANFIPDTWPLTSLILNMQGTAGTAVFTDESPNALAVTRNGDAVLVSDATFGTVASFDGNGDYLTLPSNAAFAYGTGDFTWEFWFNSNSWSAGNNYLMDHGTTTAGSVQYYSSVLRYYNSSTGTASPLYTTGFGSGLSTGTWYHLAASRQSGVTRLFRDGVLISSATDTYNYSVNRIVVGAAGSLGAPFNGLIGPTRITKGAARYTSNFTPPTGLFPTS